MKEQTSKKRIAIIVGIVVAILIIFVNLLCEYSQEEFFGG